jgi:hypothetical protein
MIDTLPEPPPAQEQVIEQKLLDCGLKAGGFSVRYEDYLQSIEIIVTPIAGATSEDFACINDATASEIVTFEDRAMDAAFLDFRAELARPQMMAELEARLKERGLWEGFPNRQSFATDGDYARALEAHGGHAPGSALKVSSFGVTFEPEPDEQDFASFNERYGDLLAIILYVSVRDGFSIGFIGNEKVRE